MQVDVNGNYAGTVSTNGAGWQSWSTETIRNVSIPDDATIRVTFLDGETNLDYLDFEAAGGGAPAPSPGDGEDDGDSEPEPDTGSPSVSCSINRTDAWQSGFVLGDIQVKNTGDEALNWQVAVEFDNPVSFSRSWSSNVVSTDDSRIVFEGASYNRELAPGQSTTFGFTGGHGGNLGDVRCSGQ